jgi:hypothetical protein
MHLSTRLALALALVLALCFAAVTALHKWADLTVTTQDQEEARLWGEANRATAAWDAAERGGAAPEEVEKRKQKAQDVNGRLYEHLRRRR